MKKIFIVLMILLLVSGCSTKKEETAPKQEVDKTIDIELLSNVKTIEELAAILNCPTDDVATIATYIKYASQILPSEKQPSEFVRGVLSEGFTWISVDEAKTMVDAYILTTDNWRDFYEAKIVSVDYYALNDEGEEIIAETADEPQVLLKDGYYTEYTTYLRFKNLTNNDVIYFDGMWPEYLEIDGDKIMVSTLDEDENHEYKVTTLEFDLDNYECIEANGVVFKDHFDEDLYFTEEYDPDTPFVIVNHDLENGDMHYLGKDTAGWDIYR